MEKVTNTPSKPKRTSRWLIPSLALLGIVGWWFVSNAKLLEGQHEASPDGLWRVDIMFTLEHDTPVLEYIELRRVDEPVQAMRWRLDPPLKLNHSLRGPDVIEWSADSSSADILLNGSVGITLRVPE